MILKVIALFIIAGSMGALELDRIGLWQFLAQGFLALALVIISEQAERIKSLKRRAYGER